MPLIDFITPREFEDAYNKVKKGKKSLSDKRFLKFKTDELNSLGNFFKDDVTKQNLRELIQDFYHRRYKMHPYTCVVLPKGSGGYRTILIPHPRDRIVFSILLAKLKRRLLHEINAYNVFGSNARKDYRNIRILVNAVRQTSTEYKYVLKIDIKRFFPSINKETLLKEMKIVLHHPVLFGILEDSLSNSIRFRFDSIITKEGKKKIRDESSDGIPQGCAYSPLLANYYALNLDKKARELGFPSFRYLDDMILFCNTPTEAEDALASLKLVADDLSLKIHDLSDKKSNKTYLQKTSETFEYLGIDIKRNGKFSIPIQKIEKEITLIKAGLVNQETIKRFKVANVHEVLIRHLDGWRTYYRSNFPDAWKEFKDNPDYNKRLRKHYDKHESFKRFLSKLRGIKKSDSTLLDDPSIYF